MAMLAMMRCVSAYDCKVQIQIFSRYGRKILFLIHFPTFLNLKLNIKHFKDHSF